MVHVIAVVFWCFMISVWIFIAWTDVKEKRTKWRIIGVSGLGSIVGIAMLVLEVIHPYE